MIHRNWIQIALCKSIYIYLLNLIYKQLSTKGAKIGARAFFTVIGHLPLKVLYCPLLISKHAKSQKVIAYKRCL